MDRTDELLKLVQTWTHLAQTAITPAIREYCRDQRMKAMWELLDLRIAHHEAPEQSAGLKPR